ncbi:MAG: hypothetical protein ACOC40_00465 [Thermoplasmatota archaeon]
MGRNGPQSRQVYEIEKHRHTKILFYHILLFTTVFLIWGLGSIYLMGHVLIGKIDIIATPIFFSVGFFLFYRREYPIKIYENGIKFPLYWKLRCGTQFLHFEDIERIEERHTSKKSRFSGTKLITKDGRKYFVLQYYEDQVLPHIPDNVMRRAWDEE